MRNEVFICDAIRTPVGKYGGSLSTVRTDDLAAIPLKALMERNPGIDWNAVDDVLMGCANQAGEDNRNVARMALLLAGFPPTISGATINRLCGSGMDAIGSAARTIRAGEADLIIAGGVESMTRAPFIMAKASGAFSRSVEVSDSTLGWRFINKLLQKQYGTDSMMETAENIASDININRVDQDKFSYLSQEKYNQAHRNGWLAAEIVPVIVPHEKGVPVIFDKDEHPRMTTPEKLATLKPLTRENGTVTAGNSSGINDGAAALIIASGLAVKRYNLTPMARILGMDTAGVLPRIMGMGPVSATKKLLGRLELKMDDLDIIELNEAFAAQALGCIREFCLADDDHRINPLGGAIAFGHPLGMSGARLVTTASHQLQRSGLNKALCTMCIGVGQGISMIIERV